MGGAQIPSCTNNRTYLILRNALGQGHLGNMLTFIWMAPLNLQYIKKVELLDMSLWNFFSGWVIQTNFMQICVAKGYR